MHRQFISLIALIALGVAQAPQAPAPVQQPPTFRAGTNVVRVDVTVVNHHGDPVTTLTKDDFRVTEDGAPQPIETFKFVEATGQPGDELSLAIRSREHAAAEAARDDVRVFVIFWDEYHIGQMEGAIRAREVLMQLVQTAFGPTDLVGLADPLTPSDAIVLTRNREDLADQVRKLQGRRGVYFPPRSDMEEAQLHRMMEIETIRAQVTSSALEATVGFLGTIKEGRKAVLFVSEGITPGRRSLSAMMDESKTLDEIVRVANTNNTAIYTFDPRSLGLASDMLMSLASQTGGRSVRSNAPLPLLKQMVRDASAFYLLGYASSAPVDGKFHKIAVRLNRGDLEVHARSGYYAPTLADMSRAKAAATAAEVPPAVAKAMTNLVATPSDTSGDFWTGIEPQPNGAARVEMAWTPREGEPVRSVTVRVTGSGGTKYFDGPLAPGASFEAPPGSLQVQRTVIASDGTPEGSFTTRVDVPDYRSTPLAVSTPIVQRARTGVQFKTMAAAVDPQPYAGREFERTDRLLVRFAIAGTAASGARVTARLLSRTGTPLTELPVSPFPNAPGTYQLELPLGSVSHGEYMIAVGATAGEQRAETLVAFRAK